MSQIRYNPEYDFILYAEVAANLKMRERQFEVELKSKGHSISKEHEKRMANYFSEAGAFFNSLSFIQKNTLNLFFHRCEFMKEYLMHLNNISLSLHDMSYDTLNTFISELCEMDGLTPPKTYDECYDFIKSYYDTPESDIDFEKTTHLIADMLSDSNTIETSIKPAVVTLYDNFYTQKVEPVLSTIHSIIESHQVIMDKDPKNFLFNLSNGNFNPTEIDIEDMSPFMIYFAPYNLYISIKHNNFLYGVGLDKFKKQKEDKDLYEPLLKFLADPKRYQMIQKLSTKKWFSNELAKEFNITPATMSYHVNKLFGLGVIHFEQGDQNRMYMELDKERLKELLTNMQKDLLG